ncbi:MULTISPECIES: hypothetical protein [unclassified Rhizobium]|uniref:hypothetical protein n=1 Tax=unclassified Rhizobium TaxID=2613769 RepID=UPI001ADD607D|nr:MULTISPECIES: hypothetical protein [unclassified Rhizobium]MBO9100344.1 hypothetical protein [Rhizobium sp. L58/93]MBO9186237.1 hypothetical protein [Rhizobium sp. E27B/91]QXZ83155.1 hypothetical protein J5287_13885 [Rhizobium sp. K1/93]QXZ89333.1 hypothetical protein J5280_14705 [Rhizobium sp. K15/93]QYA01921.1 hypothetical protein J5278_01645 [Rhizobium sp. B21/90]
MTSEEATPRTVEAAQWLADQKEPPAMAVPTIRERFSLSSKEACDACALAQKYRTARRAFG